MTPCIEWPGYRNDGGYGQVSWGRSAHRAAYVEANGAIPPGYEIDHLCRNPACVNPEHLEAVTGEENRRRAQERRTHCKNGHPYTPDNIYRRPDQPNCRTCRTCQRALSRQWKAKRKAAA